MRPAAAAIAVAIGLGCLAAPAHADRADQLFKKGKKLLGEKKYAEACRAFEQSDQLDPSIGAKLNVARCFQEWGKLATAWRWYTDAETMAAGAKDDRAPKIRELLADLDRHVPRLIVSLPADAATDHLVVRLDGAELELTSLGSEQRVDPGRHRIETVIDGAKQGRSVDLERGGSAEVTLDVPVRPPQSVKPVTTRAGGDDDPVRTRRLLGLGTGGGGVLLIGIAGIVTLRARGDYQHALSAHCSDNKDMCDEIGQTATHSARRRANISTGLTIAGLAAVGAGLYLYFTARRAEAPETGHAMYVAPSLGDATGVVVGGAF